MPHQPPPATPARRAPTLALSLAVAAAVAFGAAAVARADEIVLANGRTIEGKAQRVGDQVVIRTSAGEVRLDAKEVVSIREAPTREDLYRERLTKIDARKVPDHLALADWCREQKLPDLERKHLRAILELDADHEAARSRLGFVRHDGRWLTEEEYYAARGFVKVRGEWVSKDEIARRAAERSARERMESHVRTIRSSVAKMSSPLRKVRAAAKLSLQQYAEEVGDPSLAQFASDVASFYNEAWRAVKAERSGTATVNVRATMTTLKRPIESFETSLGAFSTPVRIQLPELSVVSVRTTAQVPLTIELDDE